MDTSMFAHLKRNWHWTSVSGKQYQPYKKDENGLPVRDSKLQYASRTKIPFKEFPCHKKINAATLQSSSGLAVASRPTSSRTSSILTVKHRQPVKKNIVRNILPRRSGRKRPSYDEVDKQALQKMNKLRVDWYPEEDKLLLLCKVGLMYLFPDWRKITIGLYIIRDVMHRVTHSYNKTSKACQRRILYIMKNPKTAKSVQQCLEEIRWSPEIAKNFGQQFIKTFRDDAEDYNEFINKVNIHFVELITVLRRIFNRTGVNLCPFSEMLPKSIKEFEERYDIRTSTINEESTTRFEEPATTADVQRSVVRNVIHSSLCSIRDKTRWNYHLYNIYKQYPDQLLRSVLARLRATQMVAVKKNMAKSVAKTGNLPLSSAPFQLSITYENQMRTKYAMSTFRESNQLLHKLIDDFNTPERKGVHISVTDGGTASGLCELTIGFLTNYEICIPEQIVILDPRIREDDPTYERILKRYQDILRNTRASVEAPGRGGDEFDEEESEDETSGGKPVEPEPEPEPAALQGAAGETQLMKRPADAILTPQGRVALSMMRLEGADADPEAKQHLHDYFVVNSSNLYVSLATRTSQGEGEGPEEDGGTPPLPPELLHSNAGKRRLCDGFMAAIKEEACVKDYKAIEDENFVELFVDQEEMETVRSIITYVKTKGVLGATDRSIFEHYRAISPRGSAFALPGMLHRLCQQRVLIRTGICEPRHVHRDHAAPWLVHTTRLTRLEREKLPPVTAQPGRKRKHSGVQEMSSNDQVEKGAEAKRQRLDSQAESPEAESVPVEAEKIEECIQDKPKQPTASLSNEVQEIKDGAEFVEGAGESLNISIRPWIRIDGTVNRRVLDQWLSTVLSYCISHPGVTMKAVQDKYQFQLPYHTRELIEMLVKLKCLHLQKISRTSISLFSKMSQTTIEPATGLEDPANILVMPMANAVLTFGAFVGERATATTFLTHIK